MKERVGQAGRKARKRLDNEQKEGREEETRQTAYKLVIVKFIVKRLWKKCS